MPIALHCSSAQGELGDLARLAATTADQESKQGNGMLASTVQLAVLRRSCDVAGVTISTSAAARAVASEDRGRGAQATASSQPRPVDGRARWSPAAPSSAPERLAPRFARQPDVVDAEPLSTHVPTGLHRADAAPSVAGASPRGKLRPWTAGGGHFFEARGQPKTRPRSARRVKQPQTRGSQGSCGSRAMTWVGRDSRRSAEDTSEARSSPSTRSRSWWSIPAKHLGLSTAVGREHRPDSRPRTDRPSGSERLGAEPP